MEKRRKLMAAWAEYCEHAIDAPGAVIQIRSSH